MTRRRRDEAILMVSIQAALIKAGACVWRNNVGRTTYDGIHCVQYGLGVGSADLIGVYHGRFIAIEVKAAQRPQQPAQKSWQRAVESCGGVYVLARTVNEAMTVLDLAVAPL